MMRDALPPTTHADEESPQLLTLPRDAINSIVASVSLMRTRNPEFAPPHSQVQGTANAACAVLLHPIAFSCRTLFEAVAEHMASRKCIVSTALYLWSGRHAALQHALARGLWGRSSQRNQLGFHDRYTLGGPNGIYIYDARLERMLSANSEAWLLHPELLEGKEHPFRELALTTSANIHEYVVKIPVQSARRWALQQFPEDWDWEDDGDPIFYNDEVDAQEHPQWLALAYACEMLQTGAKLNPKCMSEAEECQREEDKKNWELEEMREEYEREVEERYQEEREENESTASEEEEREEYEREVEERYQKEREENESTAGEEETEESEEEDPSEVDEREEAQRLAAERQWEDQEERRCQRERAAQKAQTEALFSRYLALLLPCLQSDRQRLEVLRHRYPCVLRGSNAQAAMPDPSHTVSLTSPWLDNFGVNSGTTEQQLCRCTPVAATEECVRHLQARVDFMGGRSEADLERLRVRSNAPSPPACLPLSLVLHLPCTLLPGPIPRTPASHSCLAASIHSTCPIWRPCSSPSASARRGVMHAIQPWQRISWSIGK